MWIDLGRRLGRVSAGKCIERVFLYSSGVFSWKSLCYICFAAARKFSFVYICLPVFVESLLKGYYFFLMFSLCWRVLFQEDVFPGESHSPSLITSKPTRGCRMVCMWKSSISSYQTSPRKRVTCYIPRSNVSGSCKVESVKFHKYPIT